VYLVLVAFATLAALAGPVALVRPRMTFEQLVPGMTAASVAFGLLGFAGSRLGGLGAAQLAVAVVTVVGCSRIRSPAMIPAIVIATWCAVVSIIPSVFTAGGWRGDWLEHFQRVSWMKSGPGAFDLSVRFIEIYSFVSRPPLTNSLVALLLPESDFAAYQVVVGVVGALFPLNIIWLAGLLRPTSSIWSRVGLALASPAVAVHLLFPWTKAHSAALVLSAVGATINFRRNASVYWLVFSVAMYTAAVTSHYSAVPFAFFGCAYLAWTSRGLRNWFVQGATVLATGLWWPAWAFSRFGAAVYYDTSTVAQAAEPFPIRFVANVASTFVWTPHVGTGSQGATRISDLLWMIFSGRFWFVGGLTVGVVGMSVARKWSLRPIGMATLLVGIATLPNIGWDGATHIVALPAVGILLAAAMTKQSVWLKAGQIVSHLCIVGWCGWVLAHPDPEESRYVVDTMKTMARSAIVPASNTIPWAFSWAIALGVPVMLILGGHLLEAQRGHDK
jgi:hypothetical protein